MVQTDLDSMSRKLPILISPRRTLAVWANRIFQSSTTLPRPQARSSCTSLLSYLPTASFTFAFSLTIPFSSAATTTAATPATEPAESYRGIAPVGLTASSIFRVLFVVPHSRGWRTCLDRR